MLKSWLFAIGASSITDLVCSLPYKVFDNFWFLFLLSISVVPGEIEDNYATFSGEGVNKKLYYDVQIAKKSQVTALKLSLSISCGWYSNMCLHCQTFFAFRRFSHILCFLPQIEILKNIFELQDFLNSPVKWKVLSTVKPVFNRTRKLVPSSERAIIFAINN